MPTEADTCRKFVVPKLQAAGWDKRAAFDRRAAHHHRRAGGACRQRLHPQAAQARRFPVALHARLSFGCG